MSSLVGLAEFGVHQRQHRPPQLRGLWLLRDALQSARQCLFALAGTVPRQCQSQEWLGRAAGLLDSPSGQTHHLSWVAQRSGSEHARPGFLRLRIAEVRLAAAVDDHPRGQPLVLGVVATQQEHAGMVKPRLGLVRVTRGEQGRVIGAGALPLPTAHAEPGTPVA